MIPDWLEAFVVRCLRAVARASSFVPGDESYARDVVDTSGGELVELPRELRGAWTLWTNHSDVAVSIRFGVDRAVRVDPTETSTIETVSRRVQSSPRAPHVTIAAGASVPVQLSPKWRFFAHVGATTPTSGTLTFGPAEPIADLFEVRP